MDVHRCRFVPYPASPINALAFSHQSSLKGSSKTPPNLRLAIGRTNGNIEIWNPQRGHWVQETILRGGKDRSIEGLAWTHDLEGEDQDGKKHAGKLRLFSIGYSTVITEWDLATGKPLRHSGGNYGEIWCMAVQPRWQSPKDPSAKSSEEKPSEQHIVIGCADGSLVLHSTADGDLRFLRTLARPSGKKSRVLSITFRDRDRIVAGYADSTIRIYDVRNGRQVSSMSLGAGQPGGPSEILVWSVKCLPDGTIVSGDSTGEVRFWDGQTFTLLQRIKSHKADILALAVSVDGSSIFSGGMDRRTTLYRRMADSGKGKRRRWAEISHQRYHSHDIKAMAPFESSDISVVASGGVDATLTIIPIREFGKEYVRSLPVFPSCAPLQSSPSRRLLLSWWDREIRIWRVNRFRGSAKEKKERQVSSQSQELVAAIILEGEENIASLSMSPSGDMIAISTISEVKVFHLQEPESSHTVRMKIRKIECPPILRSYGSRLVQFSPDGKWLLVIRNNSELFLHRLMDTGMPTTKPYISETAVELHRQKRTYASISLHHGSHEQYDRSINKAAWSSDSRIIVISDLSGNLDSWILEGYEDLTQENSGLATKRRSTRSSDDGNDEESDEEAHPNVIFGQHWIRNPEAVGLPKLPSMPLILSFRPACPAATPALGNGNITLHPTRHNPHPHSHDLPIEEDRLFVLTSLHEVYEFQILAGRMSVWSRRNPPSSLPQEFRTVRDRAIGSVWDVRGDRARIWLYGSSWLWMFDLSKDFSDIPQPFGEEVVHSNDNSSSLAKLNKNRKRKLDQREKQELIKDTSGAGSRIPDDELTAGIGKKIRKTIGQEQSDGAWITLESRPVNTRQEDEDDEDSEEAKGSMTALMRSRRAPSDVADTTRDTDSHGANNIKQVSKGDTNGQPHDQDGLWCWHTYKYRPILGIVTLDGKASAEIQSVTNGGDVYAASPGAEVALVERPMWDLDLPPRYHGDQEWEN